MMRVRRGLVTAMSVMPPTRKSDCLSNSMRLPVVTVWMMLTSEDRREVSSPTRRLA